MSSVATPPRRFGWFVRQPDGNLHIVAQEHVLTDVEFGEYENYTRVVNDLRAFVIDHHALTMEFEAVSTVAEEVGTLLTASLSSTMLDTPATVRSQAMAQRAVSNFLSASSALRDRGIKRQKVRGADAIPTSAEIEAKVSEIFDASQGYRIAYVLRNHAQHHENPISLTPINADRGASGTMQARIALMLDPAVLAANKALNAKVRVELAAMAGPIPLLPILAEAMTGFERILLHVLRANRARMVDMAAYLAALYSAFHVPRGATPVIFNGFEPASGPPTTENCYLFGVDELTSCHALLERLERDPGE